LNGGRCMPTEKGPSCDCARVDYEGHYCEKERTAEEATFRGREYLWWDLRRAGGEPLVSKHDTIQLSFKTRHPAGVLFFTGDGKVSWDYVNVALREGGVMVTVDMGGDPVKLQIRPDKVRFDDNQWHTLTLHRTVKEISGHTSFCQVSIGLDGLYTDKGTTAGPFSHLSSSKLHLGGADHPALLPGAETRSNFVGCLRKVVYHADSVRLDLLRMARDGNPLLHIQGKLDFMCLEVEGGDPVSFTKQESYLVLPSWEARGQGSISFKLRTNEADGLLMYNSGSRSSQNDFFAMELLEGHIYLHLNLGSGSRRVKATNRRVNDGWWHELTLNRDYKNGRITVDEVANDFTSPGESTQLDLEGPLYVGGVGPTVVVPPELWTGRLRAGYVGCMRDLVINGVTADLASYARKQDSGSIVRFCHDDGGSCSSSPCMHTGVCKNGWGRYICDCSLTSFVGSTCGKDASTVSFDGMQYVRVSSSQEPSTQAEDIIFRFRTGKPSGLLLATSADLSSDRLELALQSGRVRLTVKLGDRDKVVYAGNGMNDNQWHRVRFHRRATQLSLQVDNEVPVLDNTMGRHSILELNDIHIGLVHTNATNSTKPDICPYIGAPSVILWSNSVYRSPSNDLTSINPFVGQMQSLYINGKYIFELARSGRSESIEMTAGFGKSDSFVHHPVTFKSRSAYVALPQLKAYASTNLYFQFKTLQPSGLILYNAGKGHDFIALELVYGHIILHLNLGDGPMRLRDNSKGTLNDNKWHTVTVSRPSRNQHSLMVDDNVATSTNSRASENLDLQGFLYLGGVPSEVYPTLPRHVTSREGFEGCLASLDLNGESPDPAGKDVSIMSNHVYAGCEGPSTKCHPNACANGGSCVQQWNSYSCNCDMTSFTGPTCSDEATAYDFGPNSGILTFTYPEGRWPDTHRDLLALGFMTRQEDAVLLRLDSANSKDYMELELIDGNVYMVYNMGTEDHPIGERLTKINDGTYHVVRFVRSGPNATIQVDDYQVHSKNPKDIVQLSDLKVLKKLRSRIWHGHQLAVFNGQSTLQIGGKRVRRASSVTVERPFKGPISNHFKQSMRIFYLASSQGPSRDIRDPVYLSVSIIKGIPRQIGHTTFTNFWNQTPAHNGPTSGQSDDLVFSGAGSGCDMDDEDECIPVFDTGSGDDLITPVYIAPTRSPNRNIYQPVDTDIGGIGGGRPCDDEDCYIGSGSGEFNTDEDGMIDTGLDGDNDGGTHRPMLSPDDIHSEEKSGKNPISGGRMDDSSTTSPKSTTTTTATTTTTTRPRTYATPSKPHPTPQRHSPDLIDIHDYKPTDYDYKQDYETDVSIDDVIINKPKEEHKEKSYQIHSAWENDLALYACIVAGILIVVVIVILIVLWFKRGNNTNYKVDTSKDIQVIPTATTPMLNGQGNGNIKPGDRRPIKKQSKDIKEWYV
ncbi:unnamed protein product, partial [Meganyctiphanes norvegica]